LSKDLVVKRKLLKVERVIGETTVREAVEAEIALPFKIEKVFEVITNVTDIETEVRTGGVLVTGVIDKQLFVVDKGDLVHHVPEEIQFRAFVDVDGAQPEMNVQVQVRVLTVDTHLINAETVKQTVVLEIFVKVTVTEQIEVVVDVQGRGITVKKELLKVESVVGEDTLVQTITPTVTLPLVAKKIFRILPTVRDVSAEIKQDTVIVRGVIHKQIFLVDEGDLVRHAAEDVPFTKTVDIPGAKEGMEVQVNVKVTVEDFELIDPPSRELRQTLLLDVFVKVTETLQIDVVTNVTGPGINVVRKLLKVEHVVVDVLQRETVRSTVTLPIQAIKIFEILGQVVNLEAEARTDQVLVKGTLHKQIFFVDPTNLVRHLREDIPFRFAKNAKGARPEMNVQVRAQIIGDILHRLVDEKKLEQTVVLEIFAKVTRTVQLEVVVDVRRVAPPPPPPPPKPPTPPRPPKPGPPRPTVKKTYTVQKGDTLFLIAKRFGVPLDALIRANPQIKDPNLIFPGDVVFIPQVPGPPGPPKQTYTVQKGDTLFLIAKRFGVALDALIRANPQIKDPNMIFPGDVIFIP
jgi:spore coat assembly protein SafA